MRKTAAFVIVVFLAALAVPAWAQNHSEAYKDNIYTTGELKPVDSTLKVKVGDRAPDFLLPSIKGQKVTLSEFRGKKNVVLSFVPAAWTPVCSDQWPGYNIVKDLFDSSDAILLGITVDNIPTLKDIGSEGDAEFQMAVFGDGSFATNKYWRHLFNDALELSVVGWLAGEEELISVGSRAVRASRASLTAAQARSVFYLSVLVLPELILLCGIAVWWRRSSL